MNTLLPDPPIRDWNEQEFIRSSAETIANHFPDAKEMVPTPPPPGLIERIPSPIP